jgi:exodeoxyribonuclease VII small subunit
MADESYTFTQARARLEEIVTQVRSKDVSLEKSLDLLEEGVRLANICTEQSDHTEWRAVIGDDAATPSDEEPDGETPEQAEGEARETVGDAGGETSESAEADGADAKIEGEADTAGTETEGEADTKDPGSEPAGDGDDASGEDG